MKSTRFFTKVIPLECIKILIGIMALTSLLVACQDDDIEEPITEDPVSTEEPFENPQYNIEQATSDEAQRKTIAFDALGFMTGNLGAQTFLPPGKVADYCGFQYFRDNDQTKMGHNTSFVPIIALNILNILNDQQIAMFVEAANDQIEQINAYARKRFPLCKAFRRLIEGDLPDGTTGLSEEAVKSFSAALYRIDGEISYGRAQLFGKVIGSLTDAQKSEIDALKALNGIGNWPSESGLTDPTKSMGLDKDIHVAVMTYASEIYTWYAGSVTGDVYFCPERQGTYFGSFYLKDWPAMIGGPNYNIDEKLTGNAGQYFLDILNTDQNTLITGLVDLQKESLMALVDTREEISKELRIFLTGNTADQATVLSKSETYGELDGRIIYLYATYFAQVYQSLSDDQKSQLTGLANDLDYVDPPGAFLYSEPIPMPEIENTDFLFQ